MRLVSSDDVSVTIAFTLPDYTLQTDRQHLAGRGGMEGQTFVQVQVPGMPAAAQPGMPQLPQASVLIGLPPAGRPELRVIEGEEERIPLAHPVYPAPAPVPVQASVRTHGVPWEQPVSPANAFVRDEQAYASDTFYPPEAVTMDEAGWLRDHRVVRLTVHPIRYNPARGELAVIKHMVFQVRFVPAPPGSSDPDSRVQTPSGIPSPAFEAVLDSALLNAETARHWRASSPALPAAAPANVPATQAGSYKIAVHADGLYQLTYADLQAAGLPVGSLDPRTLQLYEHGQEIAIQVTGEVDGSFDAYDRILFYGQASKSRYTDRTVYWLCFGHAAGLRMRSRTVSPGAQPVDTPAGIAWATARYAENHFYDSLLPAADGDHWYAASVTPGEEHTASLPLMPPLGSASTATLHVRMVGRTSDRFVAPDHRATFAVNGHDVGEWTWDGYAAVTATLPVHPAVLRAGGNLVTVSLPGHTGAFGEETWIDTIEIVYPLHAVSGDEVTFEGQAGGGRYELGGFTGNDILLYDISDPRQAVQLQGATVSSGPPHTLSFADAPAHEATYLALTAAQVRQPSDIAADAPSNLYGTANGADYVIVTHADFASAVQPLAAHRRAQGLRVAVIDVQDVYDEFSGGQIDPAAIHDFVAYAYDHWASPPPTYILLVGDGSFDFRDHYRYGSANYIPPYLATVDPWWGETAADNLYVTVHGDDPLPDVLLGRLPVNTAAEARTVVHKILDYEQAPWPGDWNARHVFVADDADGGGDFAASADAVHDRFVHAPWVGHKIYLDDLPVETAQQRLLTAWNQGALLVSFVGHSSWHQWAVEALFDMDDLPGLHNSRQWPMVLSMTCFSGFFHHPEYGTLDESLLRLDGGGAVATWSPSGLGLSASHDYLYQGFYQAVFGDGQAQLGQATLAGKLHLYSHTQAYNDLLHTYHLFGDPAMALNLTHRPWTHFMYLPTVHR